jgi:hypothetical protein
VTVEPELETIRCAVAAMFNIDVTVATPKLALVANGGSHGTDLLYRTRLADGEGWHCGAAASGLLALGGAATTVGTRVNELAARSGREHLTTFTPAGERRIGVAASTTGSYLSVDTTVVLDAALGIGVLEEATL